MRMQSLAVLITTVIIAVGISIVIPVYLRNVESAALDLIPIITGSDNLELKATEKSCNCVMFTLDDVQDYWLNSIQIRIMQEFIKNDANLTLSIIGNQIGEDSRIVSFINKNPNISFASHGWDHEDFTQYSINEQSDLISSSIINIESIFGDEVIAFVPPYNLMNNSTDKAVVANNIEYIIVNPDYVNYTNSFEDLRSDLNIYYLATSVVTGDLNDNQTIWNGFSSNVVFNGIKDSINKRGYAIVTLHPQEYSVRSGVEYENEVDDYQIKELGILINKIREERIAIIDVSELGVRAFASSSN